MILKDLNPLKNCSKNAVKKFDREKRKERSKEKK
jgi:hypothetical protein